MGAIVCLVFIQQHITLLNRVRGANTELKGSQMDQLATLRELIPSTTANATATIVYKEKPKLETGLAICNFVQNDSPTVLWTRYIADILQASRHPLDRKYRLHDLTAEVLQIMTPRLRLGVKTHPRAWKSLEAVLLKAERRIKYLQAKPKGSIEEVPPVNIVVFGGSVVMGINCKTGMGKYQLYECSWVKRLHLLINQLVKLDIVNVHNMAIGGSNTGNAKVFLDYEILPETVLTPDIVINGYSTNDMHSSSVKEAARTNKTLEDSIFEKAQGFVRHVLRMCSSSEGKGDEITPPLLIWLDDYIGNEQRQIVKTSAVSRAIHVLSNYYGFGFVSYADTVRDLVYASTNETFFSPQGWYKRGLNRFMTREVHPGRTMHIATSYVMSYYFLEQVTNFCQMRQVWNMTRDPISNAHHYDQSDHQDLPALKGIEGFSNRRSVPIPKGLPPVLNDTLLLNHVTKRWHAQSEEELAKREPCSTRHEKGKRCVFSWLTAITVGIKTAEDIEKHFTPYWNKGKSSWEVIDDSPKKNGKLGLKPKKENDVGAILELDFTSVDAEVQDVAIFYLKSYGEKWEDSTASVYVESKDNQILGALSMEGFHDKNTSEMYEDVLRLPEPTKNVKVIFNVTHGPTFKILGIAVCR